MRITKIIRTTEALTACAEEYVEGKKEQTGLFEEEKAEEKSE